MDQGIVGHRSAQSCPVLDPADNEYDAARRVWNGMFDRRPKAIMRVSSIADVMQAVRFARGANLPVCVRSGAHSVAGKAVADGALVIDLSAMKNIQVDSSRPTAVVQGGVTWGEFDRETENMAWPPPVVSYLKHWKSRD